MGGGVGDHPDAMTAPTANDLAAELAGMLRSGVTIAAIKRCPAILSLRLVKAKSASGSTDDLATAADGLLREATRRVDDGDAYGLVSTLLALAPGSRGTLIKDRRKAAAEKLHISFETFRKERETGLLEAVADELYALDSAYRLRHRHRDEAERSPERSRLGIDWLEQHRSYRRIWTPITGMRNDLAVLREYLAAAEEDRPAIADRLCNINWQWARFSLALERFVREQGGLWLLADTESEIAAAEAIYKLTFYVPIGEADTSWLRAMLADSPHEELEGFTDSLIEAGERRRDLMGVWIRWTSCEEPDENACSCDFHSWQRSADEFIALIDKDWYRVADWYRQGSV
jgi:hypothetical protein